MQPGLSVLSWRTLQGAQLRSLGNLCCERPDRDGTRILQALRLFRKAAHPNYYASRLWIPRCGLYWPFWGRGSTQPSIKGIFSRWPVESLQEQRQGSANHHTTRRVDCLKCLQGSEPRRDGDAGVVPRKSDSVCVERSRARALPAAVNVKLWACSFRGLPRGSRVSGTPQARPSRAPPYSSFQDPCQTNNQRGRVMGIQTAIPRNQSDSFRRSIERQVFELESRIVPGMKGATVQTLREQVLALESKLKPADDKRNPVHFRTKRKRVERSPVIHWSKSDYVAAKWGAMKRSGGLCEICRAVPLEISRIHTAPPDQDLNRDHIECVCSVCADQFPRPDFFSILGIDKLS